MYSEIKEQFKEVVRVSQGIEDPKVDKLFETWAESKAKFINLFGGLIYEWSEPVEFNIDPKGRETRVQELAGYIDSAYQNTDLADFIMSNKDSFFDNIVSSEKYHNIPKGMKLIKAFKFFEEDKKTLSKLQDCASRVIQEDKLTGTLCLSVHPLDFISSSQNTYNWRSCHSLDGDYRGGNLSYMVDNTTFMAYVKGADGVKIPLFGDVLWNSKKWRMLLHVDSDDEIIFAGRQYPFSTKSAADFVLSIYNNLLYEEKKKLGEQQSINSIFDFFTDEIPQFSEWKENYIMTYEDKDVGDIPLKERYLVFNRRIYDIKQIVAPGAHSLNYNDLLYSSCYTKPYFAESNKYWKSSSPVLYIGGSVFCLECGKQIINIEGSMRCKDCEIEFGDEDSDSYMNCDCCGRRMHVDDGNLVLLDDGLEVLVCDDCAAEETFLCDGCGEYFYYTSCGKTEITEDGIEHRWCKHCARKGEEDNG